MESDKRDHFASVFRKRSVHEKITSFDVMLYDRIWNMCSVSEEWGMNKFEHVQSSALEGRIEENKLNCASYKIKCMKFQTKVMQSLFGFSVSFFFLISKSRTRQMQECALTMLPFFTNRIIF